MASDGQEHVPSATDRPRRFIHNDNEIRDQNAACFKSLLNLVNFWKSSDVLVARFGHYKTKRDLLFLKGWTGDWTIEAVFPEGCPMSDTMILHRDGCEHALSDFLLDGTRPIGFLGYNTCPHAGADTPFVKEIWALLSSIRMLNDKETRSASALCSVDTTHDRRPIDEQLGTLRQCLHRCVQRLSAQRVAERIVV